MLSELGNKPKRRLSYWMALAIGIPVTCLGSFFILSLYTFGTFSTWKSLGSPPSGASGIIEADVENVWVKTSGGDIYTLSRFCYHNPSCNKWLPVSDVAEISPFDAFPLRRGTDCNDLGGQFHSGNPLLGKVKECVLVPAYGYPDPEWGEEIYFAVMSDGSVRSWIHGNGLLNMYALVIFPLLLTLIYFLATSIIYLFIFIFKKIKGRANPISALLAQRYLVRGCARGAVEA